METPIQTNFYAHFPNKLINANPAMSPPIANPAFTTPTFANGPNHQS